LVPAHFTRIRSWRFTESFKGGTEDFEEHVYVADGEEEEDAASDLEEG